ncbi:tail fiber domain-containing protein [Streptomyces griseoviridis]|uniref:tail fiber domain-containing protein n=1 Tax=Streptomyces griseoviridis TaxID=45398 RepID=UPI0019D20880|nr:tail fiber domain-containing protein [Streptomyces griseoviridis]
MDQVSGRLRALTAVFRRPAPRGAPSGRHLASAAAGGDVTGGEPVNGYQLLEKVAELPVSTWRYTWDPPEIRHLGPMAQDWWAAFGVGIDDRTICCTDANGVAVVAIQALHRLLAETRREVAELREALDGLTAPAAPAAEPAPPASPLDAAVDTLAP